MNNWLNVLGCKNVANLAVGSQRLFAQLAKESYKKMVHLWTNVFIYQVHCAGSEEYIPFDMCQ